MNDRTITARPPRSLVAAAKRIATTDLKGKSRGTSKKGASDLQWQTDAWEMYDLVGEFAFLVNTLAGQLGKARLYVGRQAKGDEDTPEPLDEEDRPEVQDLLNAIGGSTSGRAQLLSRLSLNLSVAGEGWLVGLPPRHTEETTSDASLIGSFNTDDAPDPETMSWHMLSVAEVALNETQGTVQVTVDEETHEFDPDDIHLVRVWRPHPRWYSRADCASKASLPILRELVGLTMHVAAQIDSRLAGAGLLVVPQGAQRALAQLSDSPDDAGDLLTDALIESMLTPISERDSASAVVPLVLTVPDDLVAKFEHITFATPFDTATKELREEAIHRFAIGQDAPPELLLGTASMNHWGGWLVKEDTVSRHIEPPLTLICDALTTQFLWPVLEARGVEDAHDFVVWYDVDHLTVKPDLGGDAKDLHQRGVLSDTALRRANGFDNSDAPEGQKDDDRAVTIVLDLIKNAPSLAQEPGTDVLIDSVRKLLAGEGSAPIDVGGLADGDGDGDAPAPPEDTGGDGTSGASLPTPANKPEVD